MNLVLEHIAKRHNEWVRIAIYLGAPNSIAEDYVQNMYLKLADMQARDGNLNRLRNYSGGINEVYIFKILTNIIIDDKRKKRPEEVEFNFEIMVGETPNDEEGAYRELMDCIREEILKMHPYEQMLLELHFVYGMSMRQIEQETNIPTHSIFNTLKNAKAKIKQKGNQRFCIFIEERGNREKTDYWSRGCNPENNEGNWD